MVGQPGIIIAPPPPPWLSSLQPGTVTTPPTAPGLHGTGGPSWPEAALPPGSRESRGKAAGWAHRQISSTHVWASCLHPRNTAVPDRDACGRRSTQRSEGATTGACGPGLGVGKPGGRGAGTPAAGTCEQMPTWEQRRRTCRRRAAPPGNEQRAPPLPGPRQPPRGADPELPCGLTAQETPG